ncbi:MAG: serine/threonine protein phosphatase [Streptosporangiaceae bacterium]|nr:serine/threonine protein phosphatase [Streptosporangiaceae bacterium]
MDIRSEVKFKFRAAPENVRTVRELTGAVLISWALRHLMEPAKLVVSELFTNALHATPGKDTFLLFKQEITSISIGVWDSSPEMPVMGACDLQGESGRGLYIVAALADDHGAYRVGDPNGKIVWARLDL